ncbi:flagellar assembly protein FliX [Sphingomonas sp.]|uniref:flagellar assembly protein FliX n=1 Tax=Sphingomonas sp. TaxID=28214 RepID=UPI0025D5B8C0|nr:flagellar assembly protein FliX [Sphingomonas sp.]
MMARTLMGALPKVLDSFGKMQTAATEAAAAAAHPNGPQAVSQAGPATSVQMLVTLAAADPAVEQRRRVMKQAERGVDALEKLHTELLTGTAPVERLREIAEWSANFELTDDPQLAQLMSDIDLRVRVELAKYDIQA